MKIQLYIKLSRGIVSLLASALIFPSGIFHTGFSSCSLTRERRVTLFGPRRGTGRPPILRPMANIFGRDSLSLIRAHLDRILLCIPGGALSVTIFLPPACKLLRPPTFFVLSYFAFFLLKKENPPLRESRLNVMSCLFIYLSCSFCLSLPFLGLLRFEWGCTISRVRPRFVSRQNKERHRGMQIKSTVFPLEV